MLQALRDVRNGLVALLPLPFDGLHLLQQLLGGAITHSRRVVRLLLDLFAGVRELVAVPKIHAHFISNALQLVVAEGTQRPHVVDANASQTLLILLQSPLPEERRELVVRHRVRRLVRCRARERARGVDGAALGCRWRAAAEERGDGGVLCTQGLRHADRRAVVQEPLHHMGVTSLGRVVDAPLARRVLKITQRGPSHRLQHRPNRLQRLEPPETARLVNDGPPRAVHWFFDEDRGTLFI